MGSAIPIAAIMSPLLLYAGAGAASIPVLIHLLSRRRFRRVRWAAIEFLMEADRRNRRRVRIEELLLLALRCLAMFLVGVVLARWFIRPEALAAIVGTSARTHRIVLLDDSFSMGLRETRQAQASGNDAGAPGLRRSRVENKPAGTVFARGTQALGRLVQWLRQESPNDPITLLLTSRPDRPLRDEAAIGKMDVNALTAELETLSPSSRAGNLPAAFTSVRGLLDSRRSASSAVYVISDFQQVDWTRAAAPEAGDATADAASGSGGRASPAVLLGQAASKDRSLRIVLADVGIPASDNLAIVAIEPQQAQAIAGVSGAYSVRVTNFGDAASQAGRLQVYVGDAAQPEAAVPAIGSRQSADVSVEVAFPNEGSESLSVELENDALPIDNQRSLAVPVARALRTLIVDGEPSNDPYADEVFLLTVALRPEGPQFSGNDITVVDENEFEATDLASYHVVVLANVYRVAEDTAARLEEFVATGGGLQLYLGDQVDAEVYNRILYRDGKGLLPARLGEIVTAPPSSPGIAFGEPDLAHPAMRRFRDSQVPYFEGVLAVRYFATEPAGSTATSPASGPANPPGATQSGPAERNNAREGGPAHVLLRLADADRSPLLLERSFGSGRVVLVTTSADKEWTNLPDRPIFVVLEMELLQYIARPTQQGGEQLVGEPLRLPLDTARYQPGAILKLPNFPDEPAVRIEAQPDRTAGAPVIAWARTDMPGVYRIELTDTTGGQGLRLVAVNVDSRESDMRRADRTTLLESMPDLPVEYVAGEQLVRDRDTQSRRELWPTLLILLVMILMCEQALAWWFGSERTLPIARRQAA